MDCYRPARPFATSSGRPQQNTEALLYQATSAITATVTGDPSFTLHPCVSRLSLHLKMCLLWWNSRLSLHLPSLFAVLQCCSWSSSSAGRGKSWWAKGSCRVSTPLPLSPWWRCFGDAVCIPSMPWEAPNRKQDHRVRFLLLSLSCFPKCRASHLAIERELCSLIKFRETTLGLRVPLNHPSLVNCTFKWVSPPCATSLCRRNRSWAEVLWGRALPACVLPECWGAWKGWLFLT